MPLSFDNKLLFVHIPKCAGSTINKIIGATEPCNLYSSTHYTGELTLLTPQVGNLTAKQCCNAMNKSPQHLTAYELKQMFEPQALMFTVVRNPFDRLVSEFAFAKALNIPTDLRYIHSKLGFDHFVQWGLQLSTYRRIRIFDGHLETQSSFVDDPKQQCLVERIFKFEHIDHCFQFLQQNGYYAQNPPHERKGIRTHYSDYYDQSIRQMVAEFYHDDLVRWKYQFERPTT